MDEMSQKSHCIRTQLNLSIQSRPRFGTWQWQQSSDAKRVIIIKSNKIVMMELGRSATMINQKSRLRFISNNVERWEEEDSMSERGNNKEQMAPDNKS